MPSIGDNIEHISHRIKSVNLIRQSGVVESVIGTIIEASGPAVTIGEQLIIENPDRPGHPMPAEAVGFNKGKVLLMPLGEMEGICPGARIRASGKLLSVPVGEELLGRVVDSLGNPLDDKGPIFSTQTRPLNCQPPNPLRRKRITEALYTRIRAIDCYMTCGRGQRIGIYSGSGVGKSTLMGMIARSSQADVNVIGLIGERGREVRDFIDKDLGPEGLSRSVLVVATSEKAPLLRVKGAMAATAIAEYFRDSGRDVVLMIDSLTRIGMAQREIGLAIGEPPTTKGYTPSVFSFFPRLLERAGHCEQGSITGYYTVLVEGDDINDPIADATRAILDGHIMLSREIAARNHYPAIDILGSVSRLMTDIANKEHVDLAGRGRRLLADYARSEDLINIGAYVKGSSPKIDYALERIESMNAFLNQAVEEKADFQESLAKLRAILS